MCVELVGALGSWRFWRGRGSQRRLRCGVALRRWMGRKRGLVRGVSWLRVVVVGFASWKGGGGRLFEGCCWKALVKLRGGNRCLG